MFCSSKKLQTDFEDKGTSILDKNIRELNFFSVERRIRLISPFINEEENSHINAREIQSQNFKNV